jgi:hypothetical protein
VAAGLEPATSEFVARSVLRIQALDGEESCAAARGDDARGVRDALLATQMIPPANPVDELAKSVEGA